MTELDILLFTVEPGLAWRAKAAGIRGFVVDWEERHGHPQRCEHNEGNGPDTAADLKRLAAVKPSQLLCRVNPVGDRTAQEIDLAVESGATHVIVPMIETVDQVERVARCADGRVDVGIMIETAAACDRAADLAKVPVGFVFIGLLDLAIDRAEDNVFRPLADGTADRLREQFADTRFGIGGVTAVDAGFPVPCTVLMSELARLRADFVFARRSFKRDMNGRDMALECRRITESWRALRSRDAVDIDHAHREFVRRFGSSRPR